MTANRKPNIEKTDIKPSRWINKRWYIHTREHYSATERNELPIPVTTWMNPGTMLCEKCQSQKTTYCTISFISHIKKGPIHEDIKQVCGCLGVGVGSPMVMGSF